jgi:predicted ArsR family transcriptional regulator
VKKEATTATVERAADGRTRLRLVRLLLEHGPATALQLGGRLGVSSTAVRRHLDVLAEEGRVEAVDRPGKIRGRGRPARVFTLTDAGRSAFGHTYDDLATAALRHLSRHGGERAVAAFAAEQVARLEERCRTAMDKAEAEAGADPSARPHARAEALADALTAEGYAASASVIASGGQLCQHHCPVAHVAAEFPQLCEAETSAISRLVGSHVQRLATIAHGDGVCTTHIPSLPLVRTPIRPAESTARFGRKHP